MRVVLTGAHRPDLQWLAQHLPALLPGIDLLTLDAADLQAWLSQGDRHDAVVLLSGLDPSPDGVRLGPETTAQDAQLREALIQAQQPFGVVLGQGMRRLQNAHRLVQPYDLPQPKAWVCDACSDPECELKLFTGLKGLKVESPQVR